MSKISRAVINRICTKELASAGAAINIMDIGKLWKTVEDALHPVVDGKCLKAGEVVERARSAARAWIAANRTNPIALADGAAS